MVLFEDNENMESVMKNHDHSIEDECSVPTSYVRRSHHSEALKRNLLTRLKRIEGQIRGIKGLIEKDTYYENVITQIAASQSALNSVAKIICRPSDEMSCGVTSMRGNRVYR